MKKCLAIIIVVLAFLCVRAVTQRTVYSTQVDPSGNYTAVFSYRSYLSHIPMPPGSSSDKPCFVKIIDRSGRGLGEIPVPMMQMADLEWTTNGAEVKLVGEWDFVQRTCYYWSEKQDRKIYVRR